ncbi:hypothetical protein B0I35DRAFT_438211 [Stachybotrys elegans]|uniref:Uncharacterized protein n=1 Tax=Stachybotrys elegans TaxID=80388 RepID=A0A8K0SJS3_9HYPO|nr:hypothetical protein B0I35DRAFT_438211 [Stachybotrys elegans]
METWYRTLLSYSCITSTSTAIFRVFFQATSNFPIMCQIIKYYLLCTHGVSDIQPCQNGSKERPCAHAQITTHVYPKEGVSFPRCKLRRTECPFEDKDGLWNCCNCGYWGNDAGRCKSVMVEAEETFPCDHICCDGCDPCTAHPSHARNRFW